ncbi:MAG: hypothetical protein AAF628_19750 [Planctomycetota bacterium]
MLFEPVQQTADAAVEGQHHRRVSAASLALHMGARGQVGLGRLHRRVRRVVGQEQEPQKLDLTVELPGSLPVEIEDSSGSIVVRDVGAVAVADGSGSVEILGVAGDVRVTDGSGSISIDEVGGSVFIESDGSGSIDVTDVDGDLVVGPDGSGSFNFTRVRGQVTQEW